MRARVTTILAAVLLASSFGFHGVRWRVALPVHLAGEYARVAGGWAELLLSVGSVLANQIGSPIPRGTRNPFDTFTLRSDFTVNVKWYGAKCNNIANDTSAIQAALDYAPAVTGGGHRVLIPAGICLTTDQLIARYTGISIRGEGQRASIIRFVPTADDKAAFYFRANSGALNKPSIADIGIRSSDTTYRKFGIRCDICSEFTAENIEIGPSNNFTGGAAIAPFTGASSSGLYLRGWELMRFRNLTIASDIPVRIGTNTNDPNIDLDSTHFQDMYLLPTGDNPAWYIEEAVNLSSVRWDGAQSWVGGSYGFYWNCTTCPVSYDLLFSGVRTEQATAANYMFYISLNAKLVGLNIQSVIGGGGVGVGQKGFYLRNTDNVSVSNFTYVNTTQEGLNIDASVNRFSCRNCQFAVGSTYSIGTHTEVWAAGLAGYAQPQDFLYETNSNLTAGMPYRMGGIHTPCKPPTSLANAATLQIPSRGGSIIQGRVAVMYKGATKQGSFTVYIDNGRAYLESTTDTAKGSAETGIGNLAGRITVMWNSAANITIWNQLGETVTVSYCELLN